ncbi:Fe-only nitrogenase accessory protein AnfO [Bacteroidales bacterium Barb6XT]|nr:Fe-only nitrogenase accessory protein AnfO [Bacteroidales bacterium Barb6XT]
MKIAALVDEKGNALPFSESGTIKLYDFDDCGSRCLREIAYDPAGKLTLSAIRPYLSGIVAQLDGCKTFAMQKKAGLFNVIFEEELGVRIWGVSGSPVAVFPQIKEQAEALGAELDACAGGCFSCHGGGQTGGAEMIIPAPSPVGDIDSGMFQINLIEVQQKNSSLNSQEILLPFLEGKKDFIELEIICMHVPKWLDRELGALNLQLAVEEQKDGFCHAFVSLKS